jgi:hypothetical protein
VRVPSADDLIRRIRDVGIGRHGVGIDENTLTELEQGLGVSLPGGYRSFLRQLGWLSAPTVEVFGAGADLPAGLDLRARSAQARSDGVPPHLVPFAREPNGGIHYLDTSHEGPYESPVYDGLAGEPAAPVYGGHDFASWLWMRIDEPSEGTAEP